MKTLKFSNTFCLIVFLILLVSCNSDKKKSNKKDTVSLAFAWDVGPENAFVYYGLQQGFFKDEGIDLIIKINKGSGLVSQNLANKTVDFGFISSDYIVTQRIKGTPLTAILTLYHESPVCIYSLKSSNINDLKDLYGKNLGVIKQSATYPQVKGMFKEAGLDYSKVIEVPTVSSMQEMLNGRIVAAMDYRNYSPTVLKAKGKDIEVILASKYIEMAGISIATLSSTIRENEDLVQRFCNAMIKSLQEAQLHREEALAALIEKQITLDEKAMREGLLETEKMFYNNETKKYGPGFLCKYDWIKTIKTLQEIGTIDNTSISIEFFYEDKFFNNYMKSINVEN